MKRTILAGAGAIAFAAAILALAPGQPAAERAPERVTDKPELDGRKAKVPIPPEMHQRNSGGSDNAGLCVIASLTTAGRYQRVPGIERLFPEAKKRPGGYHPDKLKKFLDEVLPGEEYASITTQDVGLLDACINAGYPVSVTMSYGDQYRGPIHHFVNLASRGPTAIIDNNDAGHYRWVPDEEFNKRAIDGPYMWIVVWGRKVGRAARASMAGPLLAASGGLLFAFWRTRAARRMPLLAVALLLGPTAPGAEAECQATPFVVDGTSSGRGHGQEPEEGFPELAGDDVPTSATLIPFGKLESPKSLGLPAIARSWWLYRTQAGRVIAGGWLAGQEGEIAVYLAPKTWKGIPVDQLRPIGKPSRVADYKLTGIKYQDFAKFGEHVDTNSPELGQLIAAYAQSKNKGASVCENGPDHAPTQCPNGPNNCPNKPKPNAPNKPDATPFLPPDPQGNPLGTLVLIVLGAGSIMTVLYVAIARPFAPRRG